MLQAYNGAAAECVLYEREDMQALLEPTTEGPPISLAELACKHWPMRLGC